ncbi:MAG: hypothetical protein GF334_13215 [Candidatus Altiarchaeales archaeon]|nr:hypothetical protein [Candidatus Altiarchaeales archaeon]
MWEKIQMPTYDYSCPACGHTEEKFHSIKVDPIFACPVCEKNDSHVVMQRLISASIGGFVLGSTPSMAWKEKRLREKKNASLELKQLERYGSGQSLKPNVGGMEVDSWSDAAKVAREAGMSSDSYQPHIEKEKHTSKESGIDDRKWKQAKDKRDKS